MSDGVQAGEGVQADGPADLSAAALGAGIVGQDDGDAPIGGWRSGEPGPPGGAIGGQRHLVRIDPVDNAVELQGLDPLGGGLEGDGGGGKPAVEFGQDDLHGHIGGRQTSRRVAPSLSVRSGK